MSEENRSTHKLYEKEKIGEVQIADEVVAIIAGLAATEVEGVDSMAGNITNELVGKLGCDGGACDGRPVPQYPLRIQHPVRKRAGPGKGKHGH